MPGPTGFEWAARKNGELVISHHGRTVTVLRGQAAERLRPRLEVATSDDAQHLMASATGNYKRGNERPTNS